MIKLYDYFRSSASFRVRIALNLKGLTYEQISVHLIKDGGRHLQANYEAINPQKLIPSLVDNQNAPLAQSLAIIEYLEEQYPTPALLPTDPIARAEIRAFALHIACDIHPLNNLRVLNYLTQNLNVSEEQKKIWYHHWLSEGFNALEKILNKGPKTPFCFGHSPTLADICLVPQVYNALRFEFPLEDFPLIKAINTRCLSESAFSNALPENQQDA